MFTRIGLMFAVIVTLCSAAFSLGSKSSGGHQDTSGIPPEHAVLQALHYQHELALSADQIQQLGALKEALGKEFAPFREQAEAIQHRMQELQASGKLDQETSKSLQQESDALTAKIKPLFDHYGDEVGKLLSDEQRQNLMKLVSAGNHPSDGKEFLLNTMMQSREELQVTPQQFTKLQYLLADFIRAFAPLREKMELLQLAEHEKSSNPGDKPSADFVAKSTEIQKQVAALQSQISDQAIKDVLEPAQKAKLKELLHGEHHSAPGGG